MMALQEGVQDFVLKPFEPRRLVAAVEKLLHASPTGA
jgi:DNA-binding response OmpR family regulator